MNKANLIIIILMIMKKIKIWEFIIVIHKENWNYWAEVENLPGCFTQADTEKELLQNIKEAIWSYILSLQKDLISTDFNKPIILQDA